MGSGIKGGGNLGVAGASRLSRLSSALSLLLAGSSWELSSPSSVSPVTGWPKCSSYSCARRQVVKSGPSR